MWDHATPFEQGGKPHYFTVYLWDHAASRGQASILQRINSHCFRSRARPGRWHNVAAFIAVAAAVFVSFRRAHHEQQEEHDNTRKPYVTLPEYNLKTGNQV